MTISINVAKVYSHSELVVDTTLQPGKSRGPTGRASLLHHKANAGGIA